MPRRTRLSGPPARGALLLLMLAAACARIAPPGGGPEDRDAPRVVAHTPDSGAVGVAPAAPLEILFSEPLNRSGARDWLRIAPWPGRLEERWAGLAWRLQPVEGWAPQTTYTVLLGARATDRRGNPLAEPLAFAFATGPELAPGRVVGRVHGRALPSSGVTVFLFPWPAEARAPLPAEAKLRPNLLDALRLAESDAEGAFCLEFVVVGEPFLVAALHDANLNRAFDEGEDLWGFAEGPLVCPDSGQASVEVYLVYADEAGDLTGVVTDSACATYVAPARLRAVADSLAGILSGTRDALGFTRTDADTLPEAELTAGESDSLRHTLERLEARLVAARRDSQRCAPWIWVRAQSVEDTSQVVDVQSSGEFRIPDLPPGLYRLSALRDLNGDGRPTPGEPRATFPFPVELKPGREVSGLDWALLPVPLGTRR